MGDRVSKAVECYYEDAELVETLSIRHDEAPGTSRPGLPRDTLIIFDWDDTLLCSSAINAGECDTSLLYQLETVVGSVLELAMGLGETMIVTNGKATWVENSARRFLPGLKPILDCLTVMSARARYEESFPGDPFSWKCEAFQDILRGRCATEPKESVNLVVLGDSVAEMSAAQHVAETLGDPSLVKTVKFREAPSIRQLLGELRSIAKELQSIVHGASSSSKGLEPRNIPDHLGDLTAWACGWRLLDCDENWHYMRPAPSLTPVDHIAHQISV